MFTREAINHGPDLFGDPIIEHADGQVRRQCTPMFKIEVLERYIRNLLGVRAMRQRNGTYPARVLGLIGIAADEIIRVKPSTTPWITLAHPFVDAGVRKADEAALLRAHGWAVPEKSACKFCPFHGDDYWRFLRDRYPSEFQDAIAFDEEFRKLPKMHGETFVHSSRKPLALVNFGAARETFGNECSGLCAS